MKTKLIQGDFKLFPGRYNEQMPSLLRKKYTPLSIKDIIQYRIKVLKTIKDNEKNKKEIDLWLYQALVTFDSLVSYKGELMVVPESEFLVTINPNSGLDDNKYSLLLNENYYNNLTKKHETFKIDKLIKNKKAKFPELEINHLTKEQTKNHPIWLKLVQDDKPLLEKYLDLIYLNSDRGMGLYLPLDYKEIPSMYTWVFAGLQRGSCAYTGHYLGSYNFDDSTHYFPDLPPIGEAHLIGRRITNLENRLK